MNARKLLKKIIVMKPTHALLYGNDYEHQNNEINQILTATSASKWHEMASVLISYEFKINKLKNVIINNLKGS